jgi:pimeloyl-ACP methyl ester carboxylesterase
VRRPALRVLLVCLAGYAAIVAFVPVADRLILFPTTAPIDAGRAERRVVPFEGGELEIWTAMSRPPTLEGGAEISVLRFYGNADRAERWVALEAQEWKTRSVRISGVNYPGYGGSSGPASLARMARAGIATYDALAAETTGKPIVVYGASIGSTVALHVAANRLVSGLILHNPPAMRQMVLRVFGWWNLWLLAGPVALQIPRELDSVANAKRVRCPALFLLAERDEIVAPRFQQLVVNAYAGEKRIITLPGAGHNSPIEGTVVADVQRSYEWLLARR